MRHIVIYLCGVLLTTSCGQSDNKTTNVLASDTTTKSSISITDLERKQLNDILKSNLSVVDDGIEYMSHYTKFSENTVSDSEKAWTEVKNLYPDFAKRIKCWTEYKGYYVFSVGFNDPKTDCMFWHILYVKKGEREFRYFWPHT